MSGRSSQRLTRAVMLLLDFEGVRLPGLDTISGRAKFPPLPLDLAELAYVVHLVETGGDGPQARQEIADRYNGSAEALAELHEAMIDRGLLVSDETGGEAIGSGGQDAPAPPAHNLFDTAVRFTLASPRLFRLNQSRIEAIGFGGELDAALSPIEFQALSCFFKPKTWAQAHAAHAKTCDSDALSEIEFRTFVARLLNVGLIERYIEDHELSPDQRRRGGPAFGGERASRRNWERFQNLNEQMRDLGTSFDANRRADLASATRLTVYSVHQNGTIPPLALGMMLEYANAFENGMLQRHFDFHPDFLIRTSKLRRFCRNTGVFLFSNYNWSHASNCRVSRRVKELSPSSLTIHGGPNTPKYRDDAERYLRDNPDVDVIVRGEGEETLAQVLKAMIGRIGPDHPPDLSALSDVLGIAYRDGDKIVMTPDRPRITDLDAIPSPILSGRFSPYKGTELGIIETNRGCPYSCAFCDWGSAIGTRIRKFSLDRVFAELEWFARNEVSGLMCADANFGIFPRDVEIAQKVAELKAEYGYPRAFSVSFAKNSTKFTRQIVEIFAKAGIISKGNIAVQTMDTATLSTIQRSNIKLEKFDELTEEFRRLGLPLWVDLMFGLPGQTVESFCNDLQECIDRAVFPRIFMTELLPNSPMNDPEFKDRYSIETEISPDGFKNLVVACSTFSRDDFEYMNRLRLMFVLGDVIGMLRHIVHYARAETGLREIEIYQRLVAAIDEDREKYPIIAFSIRAVPGLLIPPASWALVVHEAHRFLTEELGVADDAALASVIRVQLAVLPSPGRQMPDQIRLPHDYGRWHEDLVEAALNGHRQDWETVLPKLRDMPAATFMVEDPDKICEFGIGSAEDGDLYGNFELRSPVSRWVPPEDEG